MTTRTAIKTLRTTYQVVNKPVNGPRAGRAGAGLPTKAGKKYLFKPTLGKFLGKKPVSRLAPNNETTVIRP
jgi:hypothetical protein